MSKFKVQSIKLKRTLIHKHKHQYCALCIVFYEFVFCKSVNIFNSVCVYSFCGLVLNESNDVLTVYFVFVLNQK